jgi:hypothetical protein
MKCAPHRLVWSRLAQTSGASLAQCAAWIVVAIVFGSFIPRVYLLTTRPAGNDLMVYLESGRALARGENPYSYSIGGTPQNHGPYPLTIDTLIVPFTWVPLWLAEVLWFGLSLAALIGALSILDRLWKRAGTNTSTAREIPFVFRLATVALVLFVPLQSHFGYGQLDLVILLMCCLFVRAQLRDRDGQAALWLGGGIALKLTPSVLVVDLVARRKVRTLLLTGVWILGWAILVPTLVSADTVGFYRGWWLEGLRHHLESPVGIDWRTRFALAGMLVRLWPGLAAVPGLYYWVAAAVLAPLTALEGRAARDTRTHLMLFGVYLTTIPLLSPISEMHHLTILLGALWVWLLAAGSHPSMLAFDGAAAALFVTFHWLGIAWNRTRPGLGHYFPTRTGSLFEGGAVLALYVILLIRILVASRPPGETRARELLPQSKRDAPGQPQWRDGSLDTGTLAGGSASRADP